MTDLCACRNPGDLYPPPAPSLPLAGRWTAEITDTTSDLERSEATLHLLHDGELRPVLRVTSTGEFYISQSSDPTTWRRIATVDDVQSTVQATIQSAVQDLIAR